MRVISRHFISQKFGRGTGTVQMSDADTGAVVISTADERTGPYEFQFSLSQFMRSWHEKFTEEIVLRCAIAQVHRTLHSPNLALPEELSPDIAPWIGDFSDVPFGGATGGYHRRLSEDERRQAGNGLEVSVEQGVVLLQSRGRPAARNFLQNACVPPSVIRRVLSNSVSRRKSCTE